MLTKNAMGNMINRYTAVLKKCRLINFFGVNVFGTLALASTIAVGGLGVGDAWAAYTPTLNDATINTNTSISSAYTTEEAKEGTSYYLTFTDYETVTPVTTGVLLGTTSGGYTFTTTEGSNIVSFTVGSTKYYVSGVTATDNGTSAYIGQTNTTTNSGTGLSGGEDIDADFIGNSTTNTAGTANIGYGGAISITTATTSITGDFIANVSYLGGALHIANGYTVGTVTGDFIGNYAGENGGAINVALNASIITITGDFIGNTASGTAGAICNYGTITNLTGDFIGNSSSAAGGAIANFGNATITTIVGNFINNTSTSTGGAIINVGTMGTITGDFYGNKSTGTDTTHGGGAIYNTKTITTIDGDFYNNSATTYGGAIYNTGGTSTSDYGITTITGDFYGNYTGTSSTEDTTTITITSSSQGGAIWNSGYIYTIGTESDAASFTENQSYNGGAIYNSGTITYIYADFYSNSTTNYGGAIYNANGGTITTITNSTFSGNSAYEDECCGGAIYNAYGASITTISGSYFSGNEADYYGGAIYNANGGTITTITNSTFSGNSATWEDGGAIYNNGSITTISGSYFIDNEASDEGGAIYNNDGASISTISGSTFSDNEAYYGGVISNYGTIDSITNSTFSGNTATKYGGAIYNDGTIGSITTTGTSTTYTGISGDFTGNTASSTGGAIYTTGSITFVADGDDYEFTNNVAGTGDTTAYNAIYVANNSSDIVLTFYMDDGSFTMNDSILAETAFSIAIVGVEGASEYCTFYLNSTIGSGDDTNATVTINNATLELGSYDHTTGDGYVADLVTDTTTVGDLYFTEKLMGDNAILKVDVGTGNTVYVGNSTDSTGAAIDEILSVGNDDQFIIKSGTFDISAATLKVDSGADAFSTAEDSTLIANIADFGYTGSEHSKVLTYTANNDLVKTELANSGSLVLVYDGLAINKTAYLYLQQYLSDATSVGVDWSEVVGTSTGSVTVDFTNTRLTGYYSLTTYAVYDEESDTFTVNGTNVDLGEYVMAGELATGNALTAIGIVVNNIEDEGESLTNTGYTDTTDDLTSSIINSEATLTLTGGEGVDLLDTGTLTNYGNLTLGEGSFKGTLDAEIGSTTSILSDVTFTAGADIDGDLNIGTDAALTVDGADTTVDILNATSITCGGTITITNGTLIVDYDDLVTTTTVTGSGALDEKITLSASTATLSVIQTDTTLNAVSSTAYNAILSGVVDSLVSGTFAAADAHIVTFADADAGDYTMTSTLTGTNESTGTITVTGYTLGDNYLTNFIAGSYDEDEDFYTVGTITYDNSSDDNNTLLADTTLTAYNLVGGGIFVIAASDGESSTAASLTLTGATDNTILLNDGTLTNYGTLTLGSTLSGLSFSGYLDAETGSTTSILSDVTFTAGADIDGALNINAALTVDGTGTTVNLLDASISNSSTITISNGTLIVSYNDLVVDSENSSYGVLSKDITLNGTSATAATLIIGDASEDATTTKVNSTEYNAILDSVASSVLETAESGETASTVSRLDKHLLGFTSDYGSIELYGYTLGDNYLTNFIADSRTDDDDDIYTCMYTVGTITYDSTEGSTNNTLLADTKLVADSLDIDGSTGATFIINSSYLYNQAGSLTLVGDASGVLLDGGTLKNYGTLNLGKTGSTGTLEFEGTLLGSYDENALASTTTVLSSVDFSNVTTIEKGAKLNIAAGDDDVVTMAGLNVGVDDSTMTSTLNITSGTLNLVAVGSLSVGYTSGTTYSDINSYAADVLDGTVDTDSTIVGNLTLSQDTILKVSSGITNIVDANLSANYTENAGATSTFSGNFTITDTGTLVAAFDDFVSASVYDTIDYTPITEVLDEDGNTVYVTAATSLSMTTLKDKTTLTTDTATLILDGETAYINKEAFAELLNSTEWANFVYDSTGTTIYTFTIDYGTNTAIDVTTDDTYTFDTTKGTITITNLNLTDYYSLSYYLVDSNYNTNDPVIGGGTLVPDAILTTTTLLQSESQSSTIDAGATLTLTGAGYTEGTETKYVGVLVTDGTVTNNGTLILSDGTDAIKELSFDGALTSSGTLTINDSVSFTAGADIDGNLTIAKNAKLIVNGADTTVDITGADISGDGTVTITNGTLSMDYADLVGADAVLSGDITLAQADGATATLSITQTSETTVSSTGYIAALTDVANALANASGTFTVVDHFAELSGDNGTIVVTGYTLGDNYLTNFIADSYNKDEDFYTVGTITYDNSSDGNNTLLAGTTLTAYNLVGGGTFVIAAADGTNSAASLTLTGGEGVDLLDAGTLTNYGNLTLGEGSFKGTLTSSGSLTISGDVTFTNATATSDIDGTLSIADGVTLTVAAGTVDILDADLSVNKGSINITGGTLQAQYASVITSPTVTVTFDEAASNATLELTGSESVTSSEYLANLLAVEGAYEDFDFTDKHVTTFDDVTSADYGMTNTITLGYNTITVQGFTLTTNYLASFITNSGNATDGYSVVDVLSGDIAYSTTADDNTLLAGTSLIANSLNAGDASGASYTIGDGASLTLNGDSSSDVLANADLVTNDGELNLNTGTFNSALTMSSTGTTTTTGDVSINGVTAASGSSLTINSGTLTLKESATLPAITATTADINNYATTLIDESFNSDSDIDGTLILNKETTLVVNSGVTNIVDATLWDEDENSTISGTITVTSSGTLVASFSDFVNTTTTEEVTSYTPEGVVASISLEMTGLEDQVELTSGATLILDGEAAYINKEAFAALLNTNEDWADFVSDTDYVIDYGAETIGTDTFTDTGTATLDNTYTFVTASGTITITNVQLTDYYSLDQFLAYSTTDGGITTYELDEAVITGDLAKDVNLTATILLQSDDGPSENITSTIASGASLTLTGGTHNSVDNVLVQGGTVENEGTLILGDSTYTSYFNANLVTEDGSTTTANGPITITGTVESSGTLTFNDAAILEDTLEVTGGETIFKDTANITGTVESSGTLTFTGEATLEDTLEVTGGETIFKDTANITGEVTSAGTLTFTGEAILKDTLEVTGGETIFKDTANITGEVTSSGTLTFSGNAELGSTLTVTDGTTTFNGTTTVDGKTTINGDNATLTINGNTTMAGVDVTAGTFNLASGVVTLTADSSFSDTLQMTDGTGIVAQGINVTIADVDVTELEDTNAPYIYATTDGNDASSTITFTGFEDGTNTLDFSVYADGDSDLIFGTLPTDGDSFTEYTYIMDTVDNADTSLLYISLDKTLTMASGTSLVVGGDTSQTGAYFGASSVVIADVYGFESTDAVISGNNNTLTIVAGSSLGLINASEGTYTILQDFDVDASSTAWNADSVTIGNCLLVVDYVSGTGSDTDPYMVTVRKDVDGTLYETDGGSALKATIDSGNYSATTTDPLGQYLYAAGEKGKEELVKAAANAVNAGAASGVTTAGMSAVRGAAETFSVRNTVVHVGSITDAGGTLLVKDANGKVTAEYNDVIEVADGGSISDAPSGLVKKSSYIANSFGIWAMPFYGHESISGAKVGSYTTDTHTDLYGVTVGMDKTFVPKGLDVLRLGLAFNMGTGEAESYAYTGNSKSEFDFFGAAIYGSMRKGAAMLSGSFSYTNTDGEFNASGVTGETNTDVWYGVLNGEYSFDLGTVDSSKFFSNFNLIPYIGVGFMTSKTDDYTTNLGITNEIERQNIFTFPMGLKLGKEFELDNHWIIKPQIAVGAIFADGDLYQKSASSLLGTSLETIKSQVSDQTTAAFGFSLDMRMDELGIFLNYDIQKSDTRTAHGVSAKLEYRF